MTRPPRALSGATHLVVLLKHPLQELVAKVIQLSGTVMGHPEPAKREREQAGNTG